MGDQKDKNWASEKEQLSGEPALEKVRELLGSFRNTMFTTVVGGEVHTRPMALQGKAEEFEGTLWFFTDDRTPKVDEVDGGTPASIIFQSDGKHAKAAAGGTAGVVDLP
jgi:general stress protein 26